MDINSVPRPETPALHGRDPAAGVPPPPSVPKETTASNESGAAVKATDQAQLPNPAIVLDSETNTTVLKFQEAGGVASFQLPSRAAVEYERRQRAAAGNFEQAAGTEGL